MELKNRTLECGCVLCICMDEERCHGCGAKSCKIYPECKVSNYYFAFKCCGGAVPDHDFMCPNKPENIKHLKENPEDRMMFGRSPDDKPVTNSDSQEREE